MTTDRPLSDAGLRHLVRFFANPDNADEGYMSQQSTDPADTITIDVRRLLATIEADRAKLGAARVEAEKFVYTIDTGTCAAHGMMNLVARRVLIAIDPDYIFPDPPEDDDA